MTRFVGDSVSARSGKSRGYTAKEARKDMQKFIETGKHPALEKAAQQQGPSTLPAHDPSRQFVFLDISVRNKLAGARGGRVRQDPPPPLPGKGGWGARRLFYEPLTDFLFNPFSQAAL